MTPAPLSPRVLVTRPADQAGPWVEALRQAGIDAVALPLIGIGPPADPAAVAQAWRERARFDLMMFVSPNAAGQFFALAHPADGDAAWPATLLAAAPGPGTAEVLQRRGVPAHQIVQPAADAPQFDSESLWLRLGERDWRHRRALIVRGDGGRDWLADQLRARGAEVSLLSAYRRAAPVLSTEEQRLLDDALAAPDRHLWFFSSSEAVDHLAALLQQRGRPHEAQALRQSVAVATHPRIAERAATLCFAAVLGCRPGVASVVACIQSAGKHADPGVSPASP